MYTKIMTMLEFLEIENYRAVIDDETYIVARSDLFVFRDKQLIGLSWEELGETIKNLIFELMTNACFVKIDNLVFQHYVGFDPTEKT